MALLQYLLSSSLFCFPFEEVQEVKSSLLSGAHNKPEAHQDYISDFSTCKKNTLDMGVSPGTDVLSWDIKLTVSHC